jgi:hypothetical protein
MPKILPINKLGDFGVNSDVPPSDLSVEWLTSGNNFSLKDGKVESFNGQTTLTATQASTNGFIFLYDKAGVQGYLHFGQKAAIWNGSTDTYITSTYFTTNPPATAILENYSGCEMGYIPVINHNQVRPEWYDAAANLMKGLPWSPTKTSWDQVNKTCQVMRAHKNFLFALGMTEDGVYMPNTYRWSHPADINGLPYTWDETDISSIAGTNQVAGDGGVIVDGLSLRDSFIIYSRNAINILDYAGDEFVWRTRGLTSSVGLLSSNCIADIGTAHIFLSDNDIMITDGNSIRSILTGRMKTRLTGSIDLVNYKKCFLAHDPSRKEVWTCIVENGYTVANTAYVYNYETDKLYIRDLLQFDEQGQTVTGTLYNYIVYGPLLTATGTWDTADKTWGEQVQKWNYDPTSPFSNTLVGVGNGFIKTTQPSSGQQYRTYVERLDFPLLGQQQECTVVACYPHIRSSGSVLIQFGSKDFEGSGTRWGPKKLFTPSTQRKVDLRSTGALHCWRVESVGSDPFVMSGLDFEYELAGFR